MMLSIVIPMYNSEDLISICLDSLMNQDIDLNQYEVLVINDGSSDKSQEVVEKYMNRYPNIALYNQGNLGNGAARNKGIRYAKGEYIYFLDADDYIAENVLSKLIKILKDYDLDILGFDTQNTICNDLKYSFNYEKILNKNDYKVTDGVTFIGNHNYRAEIWWYILNRNFLENTGITFYDRKFVQDSYITPSLFLKAKKVLFIPLDVHRYRLHENSIKKRKTPEHLKTHINDLLFSIKQIEILKNSISDEKTLNRLKNRQQSYVFFMFLRFAKSKLNFRVLKDIIKEIKINNAYPLSDFIGEDYNGFKYQFLVHIFNNKFTLVLFIFCYRLYYRIKSTF